jgi:peptidoglycan/LPS O-acetylase OafA/YrhL
MATLPVQTTSASRQTSPRFYLPELDGLRFFAFLAVFLCHVRPDFIVHRQFHGLGLTLLASAWDAGSFGVDLFFALSAYLITELLTRENEMFGHLNVKAFYKRRILRIWRRARC